MSNPSDVLIIGGGAIGIAAAYYLQESGRQVTVLEQNEIASGSSFANAGLIVPSHAIPLASPGVIADGLRWMFDKQSPFYIKPRLDLDLISWIWKFYRNCRPAQMLAGFQTLKKIGFESLAMMQHLVESESLNCDFQQQGWLMAYRSPHAFAHGVDETQFMQSHGVEAQILNQQDPLSFEPFLREDIHGSIFFPKEAHLNPSQFVTTLADRIQTRGGSIHTHTQALELIDQNGRIERIITDQGEFTAEDVLITNGAWAHQFLKKLGLPIALQPAKGYSISFPNLPLMPQRPLYLSEDKVAVTPFTNHLRLAGTLELSGMDLRIDPQRIAGIKKAGTRFMQLSGAEETTEPWAGLRPCTPDGLPIIAPISQVQNLFLSTGHAMMGITLAPFTGNLLAQLLNRQAPSMNLAPFALDRF